MRCRLCGVLDTGEASTEWTQVEMTHEDEAKVTGKITDKPFTFEWTQVETGLVDNDDVPEVFMCCPECVADFHGNDDTVGTDYDS